MTRFKKILLPAGIAILLVTATLAVLTLLSDKSPRASLEQARNSISGARSAGAAIYAPQLLRQAEDLYGEAMAQWSTENKRIWFLRSFDRIVSLSDQAANVAGLAREATLAGSARLQQELGTRIDSLEKQVERQRSLLPLIPADESLKKLEGQAALLYTEANLCWKKGDIAGAATRVHKAEEAYRKLLEKYESILNNYFRSYNDWENAVNKAITGSRKNQSVAIVVDKIGHKCLVYSKGKQIYTFEAELGPNWLGDKQHQGDQATPEGNYQVTARLSGSRTSYYKALLINYPNDEDRQRYNINLQAGKIPRDAGIGGAVEIHGRGGQGFDWTNGCVALSDHDMDKLYRLTGTGTPVIIVGSMKPLQELLSK